MRIGYACLTIGVIDANFKSITMKNATKDNLISIIEHNLNSLNNIIDYNIENNIKLFRISSDLIPFGSSPVNTVDWWDIFDSQFKLIGEKIRNSGMRASMHPGQYTVLNSPKDEVVLRAIDDLNYHNLVLDSLGLDSKNKIILHIGGVYDNKDESINRFMENYKLLNDKIKKRLVIENDDKSYNIEDVLFIGNKLGIPVVYDNLHNEILPSDKSKLDNYWINKSKKTWKLEDGPQKIHYSQQDKGKRPGAHSTTIGLKEFISFIEKLEEHENIDIMLEVKDKNLSAIKCINCTTENKKIKNLEIDWSKYKYNILEHSPLNYNKIRELLKDKEKYPVLEFYELIDESLKQELYKGNIVNAASHVWGYFKKIAQESEKKRFDTYLERFEQEKITKKALKNILYKMAIKYQENYLLNSYYFDLE